MTKLKELEAKDGVEMGHGLMIDLDKEKKRKKGVRPAEVRVETLFEKHCALKELAGLHRAW